VASVEADSFRLRFEHQFDRLLRALDGLDEAALNWKPPGQGTNSLLVLVTHTLASAEDHVVRRAAGKPVARDRDAEFAAGGGGSHLTARSAEVLGRIGEALGELEGHFEDVREAPFGRYPGTWTVRDSLVHAVAHTAEHIGQAELTRDLWRAGRT
jgi:hypothetical protein